MRPREGDERLQQAGVEPREKQPDELGRPAFPLEALAVKEKKSASELSLDTVGRAVRDSDDGDYKSDEELLGLGKKISMGKCSDREKLTGKKRTADVLDQDLLVESEEDQEEVAYEGQDAASKKLRTVRCNLKTICKAVMLLNVPQREKVKELGFGCLLDFKMTNLGPRSLVVWLMDHLNPDTMVLDFGGNRKLCINEHTVWCILGLKRGVLDPPLSTDKLSMLTLREKLGIPGNRIEVIYLLKQIKSGGTDNFTMQCFMMIVFAKLLACNSSLFITGNIWSMVQNINIFGDMNWCKFIVDQVWHSANKWKETGGTILYGCPVLLVMLYLDNLDCKHKMRCVEVPRSKLFERGMIRKLVNADSKLLEVDGLPTFGNLNLRNQRGTCYDEKVESSRHVPTRRPIPGTSDILGVCRNSPKMEEQQIIEISEDEDALFGDDEQQTTACVSSETAQGPTAVLEASADVNREPIMVPGVHEDHAIPETAQGELAVTRVSEDGDSAVPVHCIPGAAAVQHASTFLNEQQVNDFMTGTMEPEILESRLSKLVNLLAQMPGLVASDARTSELEKQVKELTQRLCNTEEELGATRSALRGAQAATLEAQSAVANTDEKLEVTRTMLREAEAATQEAKSMLADTQDELEATRATLRGAQATTLEAQAAINSVALRLSATFVRLGATPSSGSGTPPNLVSSNSLEEAMKLLEDRVALIENVSRGQSASLARSSLAFGAAALLCRDRERGIEDLHDAVAVDTRRFIRSQGPEFHSLVRQVVDAVERQHADVCTATSASARR